MYTRDRQFHLLQKFTSTFSGDLISEWTEDIKRWDDAIFKWQINKYNRHDIPKVKNPYQEPNSAISMSEVKKQLLIEEEEAEIKERELIVHEMSRTVWISVGLEIEDRQRILRGYIREKVQAQRRPTAGLLASIQEKRSALRRRLITWRQAQEGYIPFIFHQAKNLFETQPVRGCEGEQEPIEDVVLYLPSQLPKEFMQQCSSRLIQIEKRMRCAECEDGLVELRRLLRIRHALLQYKKLNVTGTEQAPNTRARALLNRYSERIEHTAWRYRAAREALFNLDASGAWQDRFRPLHESDIKFPTSISHQSKSHENPPLGLAALSEGRRELPWIWVVSQSGQEHEREAAAEMNESMRVEWAKAKARVERWVEEVQLLMEEMRRVLAYFDWKCADWQVQASRRNCSKDVESGLKGYAFRQAHMFSGLADVFAMSWEPILKEHGTPCEWARRINSDTWEMEVDGEDDADEEGEDAIELLDMTDASVPEEDMTSGSDEDIPNPP